MNLRRLFFYLLIGSVGLSAVIGIGVILLGNFGELEIRVLFTTLTITVTSIFGLACGAYLETGRGRYIPIAGIALSIISALMCFLVIWDLLDDSEAFIKSFVTAPMIAAACSHISLLSLARLDRRFSWSRIAAAACVTLLVTILLYIIWLEPEGDSDMVYRVLGVLAVLLASLTVVTPVLHKLSRQETDMAKIDAEIVRLRERIAELEKLKTEGSSLQT